MKFKKAISEEVKRIKFLSEYGIKLVSEQEFKGFGGGSSGGAGASGTWNYEESLPGFEGSKPNVLPAVSVTATIDSFKNFPCIKSLKTITATTGNQSQGPQKMNVKFKDGGRYHFGSDGSLWSYGQKYGTFRCGTKPNTVILIIGGKETEYPLQGSTTPQVTFTPNEKPPFKFQQKGKNIKMMQEYLGLDKKLQTGNFYKATENAIKKMFPTYNRSTGVTQEMFDQITGVQQSQKRKTQDTSFVSTDRQTPTQTTVNPPSPNQTATDLVPNTPQPKLTNKQLRQANRIAKRAQRNTNQ